MTGNGGEVICRPVLDNPIKNFGLPQTSEEWKEVGKETAEGAVNLHVARNLATIDGTKTLLKGIAGENVAQKAAPTVFRALKSSHTRNGIIAVAVFGGAVWLYEKIESEAKFLLRGIVTIPQVEEPPNGESGLVEPPLPQLEEPPTEPPPL